MGENDSMKHIDKDLLKELECPICMDYMKPPIVMCENGHSICDTCKKKLNQCPTCRKPFTNVRNLALESMSSIAVTSTEQKTPPIKSYKCPFAKISHENCTWAGNLKNLKKHIRTSHNNPNDAHVSNGTFNVVLTGFSPTRHYRKAQLIHQEVFYAFWEVKDGQFYCAVMNIGSESNASNFKYKFSITSKNGLKNISMTFVTRSVTADLDNILKPGECVLLHYETVDEFLGLNKTLSCDFEISPVDKATGNSSFKNESKLHKTTDSCMKTESSGKGEFFGPNQMQEYFPRGRGGRFIRGGRGRACYNRGKRGFSDNGPLGLFSEGFGNLTKGRSLCDLRDESLYQQDDPSSSDKKPSSNSNEKSGTKVSDLRSQVDNMSNSELRELIIKTMEEKFATQPSNSSSQAKYSEARRPSFSSQNTNSKELFSPIHSLPRKDIHKLLTKSFNDKSTESNKTSNLSQKTLPDASSISIVDRPSALTLEPYKSSSNQNVSPLKMDKVDVSEEKKSSEKSSQKDSGVGNTNTNIYPTKLLAQVSKSFEEKTPDPKNLQKDSSGPSTTLNSAQKSDLPRSSCETSQPSYVSTERDKKPTAPTVGTFDPSDIWVCSLCNCLASKKNAGNIMNQYFKPEGTKWFCKLCGHWRA